MDSPISLPSSPEPYSDEDNHPQPLGWWEAPPRDPPRRRRPKKRRQGPFVHNPTPDDVAKMNNRSEKALQRRLAFLEMKEREEERKAAAAEERKAAKKWYPVREDRATKRLRDENLRALSDAEMAHRAAEWRKAAGGE